MTWVFTISKIKFRIITFMNRINIILNKMSLEWKLIFKSNKIKEVVNAQPYPVFDVIQPHLSRPSSSSLPFYCALQQLLGDAVVSGDVVIPRNFHLFIL